MDVEIFRLGETSLDGAKLYPVRKEERRMENPEEEFTLNIKLETGHYEARLYKCCIEFFGDSKRILLDSKRFTVLDPDWKGPMYLNDAAPPTDMPSEGASLFPHIVPEGSSGGQEKVSEELDNLEFVIRVEQDYVNVSEIFSGQVFWIQAQFTESSKEKEKIVTLSWEGSEVAVTLKRQSPTLYRSGPYVIDPLGEKIAP